MKIFSRLVTQEEKDERIFHLLLGYLLAIEEVVEKGQSDELSLDILTLGFIFKLLKKMGYAMETKKCTTCNEKLVSGENYFSARLGGILCPTCSRNRQGKVRITDESVKCIRIFLDNKIENLGKIKTEKKNIDNLKIITNEMVRWVMN
jgi:DNA repair protein RecO (recombination protein O)